MKKGNSKNNKHSKLIIILSNNVKLKIAYSLKTMGISMMIQKGNEKNILTNKETNSSRRYLQS